MKIKYLLALPVTIAFVTLCASAKERDSSVTFTDHLRQGITISRFGTVVSFKDRNQYEKAADNAFRVCLCETKRCIESDKTSYIKTEFHVDSPKKGTAIKKGETLVVTATIRGPELTVTRRLTWAAGSSLVTVEEFLSSSGNIVVCNFFESAKGQLSALPCPPPPATVAKCGPRDSFIVEPGRLKLIQRLPIPSDLPICFRFDLKLP